ncbi:MAG: head GIN domain-containing protein [Bacteroidota bacterium]
MKTLVQSFAIILFVAFAFNANAQKTKINGSGNVVTENRSVGEFDGISVGGAWNVTLKKGQEGNLEISTDDNIMEHVDTYVKNGRLYVSTKDVYIKNVTRMNIVIHFNDIESIKISGACDFEGEDEIRSKEFSLHSSGASKISLHVNASEFEGKFSGASKAEIEGSAGSARLSMSGAGSFHAYDFKTEDMKAEISGAGSARVHVTNHLDARVSGAGTIKYKGSPDVDKSVSGAGTVKGY